MAANEFDEDLAFDNLVFGETPTSPTLSPENAVHQRASVESLSALDGSASPPSFNSALYSFSPHSPTLAHGVPPPVPIEEPVIKEYHRDADGNFSIDFDHSLQKKAHLCDFEVIRLVGSGAFGKVYQVRHIESGLIYAMKVLRKHLLVQTNSVAATRTERDILRKIRHPFFVSLHFAFQDDGRVYLVMDWMAGGPLFFHLRNEAMFGEDQAKIYIAQLILALEHLHGQSIIHRDLKPENILLNPHGNIAITDFGFAKEDISDSGRTNTFCGTIEYMAPEMIKGEQYGQSADWWSVGVLMYDMLTGGPPFTSQNRATLQKKICTERIRYPGYLTGDAISLLKGLLERDPQKRLGAQNIKAIKAHRFFNNFSWKKCLDLKLIPPFIPKLEGPLDASNFDKEYTSITSLSHSPITECTTLSSSQEAFFKGFSYVRSPDISSPLRKS